MVQKTRFIGQKLFLTYLLLLVIATISFTFTAHRANASVGSLVYDNTIGAVLEDENSIRSLVLGIFIAFLDAIMTALVGCPTDGVRELATGAGTCTLSIIGQDGGFNNGSLLAVSSNSLQALMDTPPPATLAMFFSSLRGESLVFREAQAAPVGTPFQSVIISWQLMRNAAYAILAIVVLVISIMISMRTKINPQTVVLAQTALPRVVISAILITFSYAIGAVFIQAIYPLSRMAFYFVTGLEGSVTIGPNITSVSTASQGFIVSLAQGLGSLAFGIGWAIFWLIAIAIAIIGIVMVAVKFLFAYAKITLLTIFAPLIFALAAIPGQEHRVKDWFMDMLSTVLGIPAMIFLFWLGFAIYHSTNWTTYVPDSGWGGLLTATHAVFFGVALMSAVWLVALKIPGIIDKGLKGIKK